jgi:hypothetical protein
MKAVLVEVFKVRAEQACGKEVGLKYRLSRKWEGDILPTEI